MVQPARDGSQKNETEVSVLGLCWSPRDAVTGEGRQLPAEPVRVRIGLLPASQEERVDAKIPRGTVKFSLFSCRSAFRRVRRGLSRGELWTWEGPPGTGESVYRFWLGTRFETRALQKAKASTWTMFAQQQPRHPAVFVKGVAGLEGLFFF